MHKDLGRTGTDRISGFQGVATGYVQYLTGCHQFLLVGKSADGKEAAVQWFDEQRLTFKGNAIVLDNGDHPGCDAAAPIR